jgi:hypothetical protein
VGSGRGAIQPLLSPEKPKSLSGVKTSATAVKAIIDLCAHSLYQSIRVLAPPPPGLDRRFLRVELTSVSLCAYMRQVLHECLCGYKAMKL